MAAHMNTTRVRAGVALRDRVVGGMEAPAHALPVPRQPNGLPVLLVDDDGCAEILGVSKRTLTALIPEPWMPAPITLGPRLRRWSVDELRASIAQMPRGPRAVQPEGLLRSRIERQKATGEPA